MSETDLLLRVLAAAAISLLGIGAAMLANRFSLRRGASQLAELLPQGTTHAARILVYFTTPSCVPCRTIQRPAIEAVKQQLGAELEVVEVDAEARQDVASRWGVLTVPTTYLFDRSGAIRKVNHGVVRREQLLEQLQGI